MISAINAGSKSILKGVYVYERMSEKPKEVAGHDTTQ